jgi:hypothetical protein
MNTDKKVLRCDSMFNPCFIRVHPWSKNSSRRAVNKLLAAWGEVDRGRCGQGEERVHKTTLRSLLGLCLLIA